MWLWSLPLTKGNQLPIRRIEHSARRFLDFGNGRFNQPVVGKSVFSQSQGRSGWMEGQSNNGMRCLIVAKPTAWPPNKVTGSGCLVILSIFLPLCIDEEGEGKQAAKASLIMDVTSLILIYWCYCRENTYVLRGINPAIALRADS